MRHALVEKRVAGIIRWLERLKQSYSSGAMENALMDAECAKADLEILRADVWKKISDKTSETHENKILTHAVNFSKIAVLAAIIILTAVFPISKEIPAKAIEEVKEKIVLAEPIQIIYENPSASSATQTSVSSIPSVSRKKQAAPKAAKVQSKNAELPQKERAFEVEKVGKKQKKVAYEELFSLMQTGQKALKNNKSVVKID